MNKRKKNIFRIFIGILILLAIGIILLFSFRESLLKEAIAKAKKYIVEKDGAKALGPINLSFNGDTYSVSGETLTLGNKKPVYVDQVGWEIPAISTVTKSGNSYKISIKGGNGKYKFDVAEFTLTAEQAKNIGL